MEACALVAIVAVVMVVILGRATAGRTPTQHAQSRIATPAPRPSQPKWLGYNDVLQLKGHDIAHPMTYVSTTAGDPIEPSQIDKSLRVRQMPTPEQLPYWPSYAQMSPAQRYVYLAWLATDRSQLPPGDGYLFVYYYGLERRALVEGRDQKLVFNEVQRLRQVYEKYGPKKNRNSFMNYSSAFLWFLAAHKPEHVKPERIQRLTELTRVWNEDKLAAALAWHARQHRPLSRWLAFVVAEQSPQSTRSVVTRRVENEFKELFFKRYDAELGGGLKLKVSKRPKYISYQPASAVIEHATIMIPNVPGIPSQFKRLSAIWNGCIDDLRKLSSVSKTGANPAVTAAAWEAMPPELRESMEHPHSDSLCALVSARADDDGHVFVEAGALAGALGVPAQDRFPVGQSRKMAETAEHIGFAVEPDARLTGKGYKATAPLLVFPQTYEGRPDPKRYGGAACMMRLGLAVAAADGTIDGEELMKIRDQIDGGFELNDHECRRLDALETLLLKTGSDITGLGKRLQEVTSLTERRSIGRLLVAVAASDAVITRREHKALRKCYRALGLDVEILEETLQELAPRGDDVVTVAPAQRRAAGETIPTSRAQAAELTLDHDAIARIMHETQAVSSILAKAMDITVDEIVGEPKAGLPEVVRDRTGDADVEKPTEDKSICLTLPERYRTFYTEMVARSQWSRDDAIELAQRHGQLLGGVVESINDWAFDELGGQLIHDNGDGLELDLDLLEQR